MGTGKLDRLEAAGLIVKDHLTDEEKVALENLSDDEITSLIDIMGNLSGKFRMRPEGWLGHPKF